LCIADQVAKNVGSIEPSLWVISGQEFDRAEPVLLILPVRLQIIRRRLVLLFDGAGLGLFAVAGTQKALIAGLNPVMAIFMGVLTGIGGGILRDVLVNQMPTMLQADIYAVAALAAGVVVVIGYDLHYPAFVMLTVGALLCFWLRVMAIYRGWHLPVAQSQNRRD
jgi:uncharacterized membrane protein YeiH